MIPSNFSTGRVNLISLSDKVSLKECGIICILSEMIALTYFSHEINFFWTQSYGISRKCRRHKQTQLNSEPSHTTLALFFWSESAKYVNLDQHKLLELHVVYPRHTPTKRRRPKSVFFSDVKHSQQQQALAAWSILMFLSMSTRNCSTGLQDIDNWIKDKRII